MVGKRARVGLGIGLLALAAVLLAVTADDSPQYWRRLFGLWHVRDAGAALALAAVAVGLFASVRSRRALLAFVASGASLVFVWLVCEVAGLVGIVDWPKLLGPRALELGGKPVPNLDVSGTTFQDTASAWGMPSDPVPFHYRTDRRGFRNEPDLAEADVYLLGDSILVSALLPFDETLVALLTRQLARPVVQVALIAIGPQQEQELFRASGLDPRGRLVLQFVFEGNDLGDSHAWRTRDTAPPDSKTSLRERTLLHQLVARAQLLTQPVAGAAARRSCDIGGQTYTFFWTRESYEPYASEAGEITAALEKFAGEIRSAGGRYAVVLVPDKLRVLAPFCRFPAGSDLAPTEPHLSPLRASLLAWSARSGVPVLDLTQSLIQRARSGHIPFFWGDTHMNAEGHAAVADALAAWGVVSALPRTSE
jgi:lysophospholipase L1-like esterase